MSCSSKTDELAHLDKSVSVSYSLSFPGVVITAGPLSGTPASRSLAHGLSYPNVPLATPSRGALFLNKSCYATWRVRVLMRISEQLLGVGMTLSLGRRHAYEKDTLLQTMRLPIGESGV